MKCYQPICSDVFYDNLANFRCKTGIVIDILSGASCKFCLMFRFAIAYLNRNHTCNGTTAEYFNSCYFIYYSHGD